MQNFSIFQDIPFYLILPHSYFKIFWSLGVLIIISILAIYMPYELAFLDDSVDKTPFMVWINILIDIVFIVDCVLVLITTYEKPNGLLETKPKRVILNNLTFTYFFDLLSSFPSFIFSYFVLEQLLKKESGGAQLVKLARLPRLYRMVKLIGFLKIFRVLRYNKAFQKNKLFKWVQTSNSARMLLMYVVAILGVHLFACFWFMVARFEDFNPQTWVYRADLVDESTNT